MLSLPRVLAALPALALLAVAAPPARADQYRDLEQPFLDAVDAPRAWTVSKGAGITVAVIDSGVDPTVSDLAGSVTTGPDYARGANPPGVAPKRLHGTNMASIIAGHGHGPGGADGVIGIAPEARILSVRVILERDEPGFATYSTSDHFRDTIPKGIRYAVDHGATVLNLSLGRKRPAGDERAAIAYAVSKGVVVVASAGNDGESGSGETPFSYPASYPGVISVAAVGADHRRASFSDRNSAVVVSAPGVNVIGEGPGNTYWHGDGTSPAAAFVSGTAALIRSKYPKLAPALVTQAIISGTAARPSGGYDDSTGFGEIDAAAALEAAGRLAGYQTSGAGLPATRAFGTSTGPVEVVHHDRGLLAAYSGVATAALLALLGGCLALVVRRRTAALAAPPPLPFPTFTPFPPYGARPPYGDQAPYGGPGPYGRRGPSGGGEPSPGGNGQGPWPRHPEDPRRPEHPPRDGH